MRNFLTFLSAFILIFLLYSLFFLTVTRINKNNATSINSYNNKNVLSRKVKWSIEQIDSLTASENYRFTIQNYYKDYMPTKAIAEKTTKI
jgi:hypothetical protein